MTGPTHRFLETNGIRMHVAEQGGGPLVLLCHETMVLDSSIILASENRYF
jgi:hypothetical protein